MKQSIVHLVDSLIGVVMNKKILLIASFLLLAGAGCTASTNINPTDDGASAGTSVKLNME